MPEESSTISSTPNSRATASITAVPRSLNEPVGAAELELGVEGAQAKGVGDSGQGDDGRVSFTKGHGGCIEDGIRIRGIGHDERGGALLAVEGTHVGGVVSGAGGASEGVGVHGGWVDVGGVI